MYEGYVGVFLSNFKLGKDPTHQKSEQKVPVKSTKEYRIASES